VWGKNFMVCRLCVDAARDAKRKRNAPASPGPTPEGRETNWLAGALAKAKATAANVLTPEQVQEMRVRHERTIRAAQAETLREVLAELSKGVDYRTGYEAAQHYSRTKLSAITGGTEEP
jgi:hypothetical protein